MINKYLPIKDHADRLRCQGLELKFDNKIRYIRSNKDFIFVDLIYLSYIKELISLEFGYLFFVI